MRTTLIHNPTAGDGEYAADHLLALLRDAGHAVRHRSTRDEDWADALTQSADLVIAAGGDGTVTKVAAHLPGEVPLAILPCGTANNIATALGIAGGPGELIAGWAEAAPRPFDLWTIQAPDGAHLVVEGVGLGVIAQVAARMHGSGVEEFPRMEKLARARGLAQAVARHIEPFELRASCDGQDIAGRFLLVEGLNVGFAGPRLPWVGTADPGDRMIDVLLLHEELRADLCAWLEDGAARPWRAEPSLRGRSLRLEWNSEILRIGDNAFWPSKGPDPRPQSGATHHAELAHAGRSINILAPARSRGPGEQA